MSTERNCPACGKALASDAPEGLCAACLIKAGFGTGLAPEAGQASRMPAFAPPSVAELTKLFPQLEVQQLLGQGGMGAVYQARQPALDRLVALKILPPLTNGNSGFAERFTREARALARLNHPNIVAVYDFGSADGLHYFIMEYVEGVNLRQLQAAGKLSPREALKIIPQICDALQYAHDQGVVHRDIKPENVMLDKKGRVKITDFGLAKILGRDPNDLRLTGAKEVMGTPHYMAPEQIEHPQEVDHRADIYSLGVVFYEMLTGELPLGKFQPPSKRVEVDVRLDEVVLHALEKQPERRYQQASQVKTDVQMILSQPSGGLAHRPDLQPGTASRPTNLRPLWAVALLLILAVIALAAVVIAPKLARKPSKAPVAADVSPLTSTHQLYSSDWTNNPKAPPLDAAADSRTPIVQSQTLELLPNGVTCFRMASQALNNSSATLTTYRFINSDFINVTNITDARQRPIQFTTTHQNGVFDYSLTLNEPVLPGQPLSVTSEGTATGQVKSTGAPGVFEYSTRHWPVAKQRTRRIEFHRLPAGAQLLDKEPNDLQQRVRDGRVELFIDRLIPPGDSLEIIYHYRLPTPPANP